MFEKPAKDKENIPNGLEIVPFPRFPSDFTEISYRIVKSKPDSENIESDKSPLFIPGFDDVIGGPFGDGLYYNTQSSRGQLIFAVSLSRHPLVREIIEKRDTFQSPEEIIAAFRREQILAGIKIIDLGCGRPNFALAAKALGAQAFTVDIDDLPANVKARLDGHIVTDINATGALPAIQAITDGEFDLVSENIIESTPLQRHTLKKPTPQRVIQIGAPLLKPGGYLYYLGDHNKDCLLRRKLRT